MTSGPRRSAVTILVWVSVTDVENIVPQSAPRQRAAGNAPFVLPMAGGLLRRPQRRDDMRMLHTMLRVGDLEKSLRFYCDVLGMRLLRRKDYPSGRFTLAFVGYGDEETNAVIELTHNWDTDHYDLGTGYGHVALGVEDIYDACQRLRDKGAKIVREPGPMKHGGSEIAFVQDPDGYKIELIQLSGPNQFSLPPPVSGRYNEKHATNQAFSDACRCGFILSPKHRHRPAIPAAPQAL